MFLKRKKISKFLPSLFVVSQTILTMYTTLNEKDQKSNLILSAARPGGASYAVRSGIGTAKRTKNFEDRTDGRKNDTYLVRDFPKTKLSI